MASIDGWGAEVGQGEALLAFRTPELVTALELASLITALGAEYSRINRGRELAIVEIRTGSLFVLIADSLLKGSPYAKAAIDYLGAASAIGKLVTSIRRALEKSKQDPSSLTSRNAGSRTAREIVKIAAQHGAALELHHKVNRDGEELTVRLEANEAQRIQLMSDTRRLSPPEYAR
ncbi:hypothetical protein [Caulobacter rhizosphaerae]|jgi:hypothetical protein|uniref:hypothetical protein n=1 Tax=Caulobacter rhizosphaerae TaxID=2010972 RepID=UPI0013D070F6|nr:hypothetical protein [Caulobacter rhizosphaerae]GGL29450.1 hypothetical protein GCM10010983_28390 [Caulobacter rhizosphaerae]